MVGTRLGLVSLRDDRPRDARRPSWRGLRTTSTVGPSSTGSSGSTGVMDEALAAFMAILDPYTLADMLAKQSKPMRLFKL